MQQKNGSRTLNYGDDDAYLLRFQFSSSPALAISGFDALCFEPPSLHQSIHTLHSTTQESPLVCGMRFFAVTDC